MLAALAHFGEQHRRDGGHVGGFRAGNAGDQIHRAQQHVGQAAPDMADQTRPGSSTITRAMPVISISRPRKTNIGTDSSNRLDMPSSIRLTTTDSGMSVVSAR